MIIGYVAQPGHPTLRITVGGLGTTVIESDAIVDTGFNRFLTLPPGMVSELGLVHIGQTDAIVANREIKSLACYRGYVDWDGKRLSVPILAVEGMPLVGMGMLRGYHLGVDCMVGGAVEIKSMI